MCSRTGGTLNRHASSAVGVDRTGWIGTQGLIRALVSAWNLNEDAAMSRLALVLVVAACSTTPEPELTSSLGPPLPDRENNGHFLLGDESLPGANDAFDNVSENPGYFYSVKTTATRGTVPVETRVQGIALVAADGKGPAGLKFKAAVGTSELRITAELPALGDQPLRYLIERRADSLSSWADPCHGQAALPFDGRFTSDRRHVAQVGEISFGCDGATAYKCAGLWGYLPSAVDNPTQDDMWDVHEACTHMASSTYCMDATSYTRDGSYIELMDDWGVSSPTPPNMTPAMPWRAWMQPMNQWPPARHTYYLEGGWNDTEAPVCLSRTRWASLPPDPCPGVLPDPRTTPGARYCEEYSNDALTASGALVWNTSRVHDLPMHTWRLGTERVTTVRGFHDDFRSQPPSPLMTYESSAGMIVREPTTEMIELYPMSEAHMYCEAGGTRCVVATPATVPASHTVDAGFEGYVFDVASQCPADSVEFALYKNATTGDFVSAVVGSEPAGYLKKATIGYVLK